MTSSLAISLIAVLIFRGDGCGGSATPTPLPSEDTAAMTSDQQGFSRLLTAHMSGFDEGLERVIRTPEELTDAWKTIYQSLPGNPPPQVDFRHRTVLLLALGSRNSGGYSIKFERLAKTGGVTVVHYTITSPGRECMTTQSLTAPVDVVSVPRVNGTVRFQRREVVQHC